MLSMDHVQEDDKLPYEPGCSKLAKDDSMCIYSNSSFYAV